VAGRRLAGEASQARTFHWGTSPPSPPRYSETKEGGRRWTGSGAGEDQDEVVGGHFDPGPGGEAHGAGGVGDPFDGFVPRFRIGSSQPCVELGVAFGAEGAVLAEGAVKAEPPAGREGRGPRRR
jgi:hypothetical protein